jgi:predicted glycosyltransferase
MTPARPKKIWIDLDNSPHVPFFRPIIKELDSRGYHILLTARDSYQVCELLSFHGLSNKVKVVGRHYGKNRFMKIAGTCFRVAQLLPLILREKPDLAVSHGSRAQFLSAFVTGTPSILLFDYEFVSTMWRLHPDWVFAPDLIPESTRIDAKRQVMRYPGLKEDVYIPQLRPDPSIKAQLGLNQTDLVVTVRPPATEAHYHNPEAEKLLDAVLDLLTHHPDVRVILVPRNEKQVHMLRMRWDRWIANRKIIIPEHVVNGLNLIWFSDFVISGGGTMNREAAALGVPVYSIFRGRIGAVDQYLANKGRLTLIESVEDVQTKIMVKRRAHDQWDTRKHSPALDCIVNAIISIVEHQCLPSLKLRAERSDIRSSL